MDFGTTWEVAVSNVTFQTEKQDRLDFASMQRIFCSLQENELFEFYEELALDNFRSDLKKRIIPTFRTQVLAGGTAHLLESVRILHESVRWYFRLIPAWPDPHKFARKMADLFMACLLWDLDSKIKDVFTEFYAHAFQVSTWKSEQGNKEETSMEEDDEVYTEDFIILEWSGRSRKMWKENCKSFLTDEFLPMATYYLFDLDLLSMFAEQPICRVLEVEIKRYVERTCKGEYEKRWIHTRLKKWIETEVMHWLENVFGKSWDGVQPTEEFNYGVRKKQKSEISEGGVRDRVHWGQKLSFMLYETYTEMRISEMFRIITDFPESLPAIEDLKVCLERTNQRPYLIETLKKDLSSRVLHPGVCTGDIINMYIGAVKALRLLDPSGVVMEIVLEPYTKYLTGRDDAVRMIMTGLLDDDRDNSDLAMELARGASETAGPVHARDPNDSFFIEEVTRKPEDWVPDPREADPEKPDKSRRTSDIISLLVGMYGSTEHFIKEYQELLSRRLLSNWCAGTSEDAEIKNLELLKLRFGEDDMGRCAVMLKDVADSRRINTYVRDEYSKQNETKSDVDVSTLIVSSEYWPELQLQDMVLPPDAQEALAEFNKGYEAHKASRSLRWLHGAGRVDIELELKDRTLQMQVTPLLASVITLFQDKDTLNLSEISGDLKIPVTTLRRNIAYWLQQGVLRETKTDTYTVIEERSGGSSSPCASLSMRNDLENLLEDEEGDNDADAENQKQKQQEQVLWNYIQGMLMNFSSLPLDRIHKMLRMFAMQDSSMLMDQTKLRNLLNKRVQEGTLCIEAGKYQLNKDS